jgi:hypothetical protein
MTTYIGSVILTSPTVTTGSGVIMSIASSMDPSSNSGIESDPAGSLSAYSIPKPDVYTISISETLLTNAIVSNSSIIATHNYRELSAALVEMVSADSDDEWRIDAAVYNASSQIATWLMANSYPVPRVFNHGPRSVVLNWAQGVVNRYLTISSEGLSSLTSSPERITFRRDYAASELFDLRIALPPINSLQNESAVISNDLSNTTSNTLFGR